MSVVLLRTKAELDAESRALAEVMYHVAELTDHAKVLGGEALVKAMWTLRKDVGRLLLLHCQRTGLTPDQVAGADDEPGTR